MLENSVYIAICRSGQFTEYVNAEELKGKRANEILQFLKLSESYLVFHSPYIQTIIPDDCIVTEFYPELLMKEKQRPAIKPPYHIRVQLKPIKNEFMMTINADVTPDIGSGLINIFFSLLGIDKKTGADIAEYVDSMFPFDHTSGVLYDDSTPVSSITTANEVFEIAKTRHLIFQCNLTDSGVKKVIHRSMILSEILSTEKTYIDDLTNLVEYWTPKVKEANLFSDEELGLIFDDFPKILDTHTKFYNALEERTTAYSTAVADVFIEYAQIFKVSEKFISNYNCIQRIIISKNQTIDVPLKKLAAANGKYSGRDLPSFLVTPVQRMPRYMLFLKELRKFTPPSHTDFENLVTALNKIQEVANDIDAATGERDGELKLLELIKRLGKQAPTFSPKSRIISSPKVITTSPSTSSGVFYLITEMVILTKIEKSREELLFSENIANFHYFPDSDTISFTTQDLDERKLFNKSQDNFVVKFGDTGSLRLWINNLETARNAIISDQPNINHLFRWYDPPIQTKLDKVTDPGIVECNSRIYIFGGETQKGEVTNNFFTYALDTGLVTKLEAKPCARTGHSMSLYDGKIYIFGGRSSDTDYLNDMWCFDPNSQVWSEITFSTPPAVRAHHKAVVYHSSIIIFGGMRKKGQYLNDVVIIKLKNPGWQVYQCSNAPQPRIDHSVSIVKRQLVVYGGRDDKNVFSDITAFDLYDHRWVSLFITGSQMPRRFGHSAIEVGDNIVFVGGSLDNRGLPISAILPRSWKHSTFTSVGNYPTALMNFGMTVTTKQELVVFGGIQTGSKKPSNSIFRLVLPAQIHEVFAAIKQKANTDDALELHARARVRPRGTSKSRRFTQGVAMSMALTDKKEVDEEEDKYLKMIRKSAECPMISPEDELLCSRFNISTAGLTEVQQKLVIEKLHQLVSLEKEEEDLLEKKEKTISTSGVAPTMYVKIHSNDKIFLLQTDAEVMADSLVTEIWQKCGNKMLSSCRVDVNGEQVELVEETLDMARMAMRMCQLKHIVVHVTESD